MLAGDNVAVKVTLSLYCWLVGVTVTAAVVGAGFTVRIAALDVAVPHRFVNTARNFFPLSASVNDDK